MQHFKTIILFFLFVLGASAQPVLQNLTPTISAVLADFESNNMSQAWLITGEDTVYAIHFQQGEIKWLKSSFGEDSIYEKGDSTIHTNRSLAIKYRTKSAFVNNKLCFFETIENGKRTYAMWQNFNVNGKLIYQRIWQNEHDQTIRWFENGKKQTHIKSGYNDGQTYRTEFGDTNSVYSVLGKDTTNHSFSWPGYSETKRYNNLYINRNWGVRDSSIRAVKTAELADSTLRIEKPGVRYYWHYTAKLPNKAYELELYAESYRQTQQLDSLFQMRPQSDTAYYEIEKYGVTSGGVYRKLKVWRFRPDSSRYKQIAFFWHADGTPDHVEITNRWGITRKKPLNVSTYKPMAVCGTGANYQPRSLRKLNDLRFRVLNAGADIRIGEKRLDQLILANAKPTYAANFSSFGDRWQENMILEFDAQGKLLAIHQHAHSVLDVSKLKKALSNQLIYSKKDMNTTLVYINEKGEKQTQNVSFLLLPILLLVSQN